MRKNFVAYGGVGLLAGVLCCFSIISCGEGVVSQAQLNKDHLDTRDDIDQVTNTCFNEGDLPDYCYELIDEIEIPSSESGWEPSSESGGEPPPSSNSNPSSESGNEPSSSSRPNTSSTSNPSSNSGSPSSSSRPSSSGGGGGGGGTAYCAGLEPGGVNFKCEWSGDFVSGKKVTPTIKDISGGEGCTNNISYAYQPNALNWCTVTFKNGDEYSTGSEDRLESSCQEPLKYFSWPVPTDSKDETLDVKASVKCGNSCKQIDCPLTLTASPKPNVTGEIKCNWPLLPNNGTNKYLSIDADLPNCDVSEVTVTNPSAECGEVTYELSGSTSKAGEVSGNAVATCSGTKKMLKDYNAKAEYKATVVDDPVLGACTWNKDKLSKGAEAIPTAELTKDFGRCGTGDKVTYSGGFPKVLTESDVGTVKGIKATANCETGNLEETCPDLEVVSAIYTLKTTEDKINIPNETIVIEMDLPSDWKNDNPAETTATFFCRSDEGSVSGTLGTGSSAVNLTGTHYATTKIPLAWVKNKYSLQVNLKCSNSCLDCGVGW
jgi:hypothetical protein